MATSTYMSFLMHMGTTAYEKLIDITEYPDLGGDPDMLETTTQSDGMRTYILGLQNNEGMSFNANYDSDDYDKLKALEGADEKYAVWFGGTEGDDGTVTPTGSEGKFSFGGQLSVHVTGAGINAVRGMSITIAPTTKIVKS